MVTYLDQHKEVAPLHIIYRRERVTYRQARTWIKYMYFYSPKQTEHLKQVNRNRFFNYIAVNVTRKPNKATSLYK